MPMPVSETVSTAAVRRAPAAARPAAGGVNLTAFESRFATTCRRRSRVAPQLNGVALGSTTQLRATCLAAAAGRMASSAASATCA